MKNKKKSSSKTNSKNASKSKYKLPVLLFDNDCILCRRFKDALERLPGTERITMIPIQEDAIYLEFPEINKQECFQNLHLIDENRKVFRSRDALEFLIKQFPGVENFAWLMESDMGKKTLDFFYNTANKLRESIKEYCPDCGKDK